MYKQDEKNTSENSGVCGIGNPINPATGAKYLKEQDYAGESGALPLRFERQYNSKPDSLSPSLGLGWGWRHTYSRALAFDTANPLLTVRALRPDGGAVEFPQQADGTYKPMADINDRLQAIKNAAGVITAYQFTQAEGAEGVGVVETYDAAGRIQSLKTLGGWVQTFTWSVDTTSTDIAPGAGYLIAVRDTSGRQLQFKYNDIGQLRELIDPAGQSYTYSYDDNDNLVSVRNPKQALRTYHYNEADHIKVDATATSAYGNAGATAHLPHALTGITDQANTRYADYRYQYDGRAIQTTHALGANQHSLSYQADGSTVVTDPLNQARTYQFAVTQGVAQQQDQDVPCSTGSPYKSVKSDANGNPEYRIDFNGNRTNYVFDTARNLETSRTEGLKADGTAQAESRTITTAWHATWRLPIKVAQPLKLTTYAYNSNGTLKSRTEQATTDKDGSKGLSPTLDAAVPARTWAYTYDSAGQVLTVDGPRTDVSDVTTLSYYSGTDTAVPPRWHQGDLQQIKNALGQLTNFNEYNTHGNPLKSTDANGLVTQYEYDELARLISQSTEGLKTSLSYDERGLLQTITQPDGVQLTHSYDDAHRLMRIQASDGSHIDYTLDAMGNRLSEKVFAADATNASRAHTRQYSALNRLTTDIGATNPAKQITRYAYDLGGNLQSITDPLQRVTAHTYDALNRLKDSTLPEPASGVARPVISYGYNGQDRLISLTDPRALKTTYTLDGLGNQQAISSPDAGAQTLTVDAAGNIKTAKDAKGQTSTYTYDELNRLKDITFQDGSKHKYSYDSGTNALGRISQISEQDAGAAVISRLDISYDSLGRVSKQSRTLAGKSFDTQYSYDSAGRLATLTYPSGRQIKYSYDAMGRIGGVSTAAANASPTTVVSAVKYHPFGGVAQFTYGNGQTHTRPQDADGRTTGYTVGSNTYAVDYDAADQISAIRNTASATQTSLYQWDGLGRLNSADMAATGYTYKYDAVGNRTASSSATYTYPADKNLLTKVGTGTQAFDANGSLTSSAAGTFSYDSRGRLTKQVGAGGTTNYVLDAQGLRVRKANPQGDVIYIYDQQGQLIAESSPAGTVLKEYIYLGTLPVAVVAP